LQDARYFDQASIDLVLAEEIPQDRPVCTCYSHVNHPDRGAANDAMRALGINLDPHMDRLDYLRAIARSRYTICPRGNGWDTHRVMEALVLGSVPVVKDGPWARAYDWTERVVRVPDWSPASIERALTTVVPDEPPWTADRILGWYGLSRCVAGQSGVS
jgi:hypothetical protein